MPRTARAAFPASARAPRAARVFLAETLGAWGVPESGVTAGCLVVSELVTNAVLHAASPEEVEVALSWSDEGTLRVAVSDQGREEWSWPGAAASVDDEHGRGRLIVEAVCARSGVDRGTARTLAWCEIDTSARDDSAPLSHA
jgi:anti-sigma regulatory factor (Ser/Thr protein kinase)